jgi:hypothetical protein
MVNGVSSGPWRVRNLTASGRLRKRSEEEIAEALDEVVALLGDRKKGLRSEEIRLELGMQSRELPRILKVGIAKGILKPTGQTRGVTYSVRRPWLLVRVSAKGSGSALPRGE